MLSVGRFGFSAWNTQDGFWTFWSYYCLTSTRLGKASLHDQQLLNKCPHENILRTKLLFLVLFYMFATESIFVNVLAAEL